ncbi:C6 transcription factor [Apiospora hydei]|uniref:C6 transcription factor n=1 Tax=Apiospora hydei TaxID=1337664 RepID=A0ABR1VVN2_9PEZI
MATETRSQDGCWSCRLRKKKCDERRPICTECMCLGLECHGFGKRPAWMDRGVKQKAQAAKMKQKVAQLAKSRRNSQMRAHDDRVAKQLQHATCAGMVDASSTITVSLGYEPGPVPLASEKAQLPEPAAKDGHSTVGSTPILSTGDSASQSSFEEMTFLSEHQLLPTGNAALPPTFEEMDFLSEHHFDLPELESVFTDTTMWGFPDDIGGFPMPETQSTVAAHGTACMLPITDVEDAMLLAYYLGNVFGWQFPFCSATSSGFDQGCFIWLMSKSRPLYLASLALSNSHKSRQSEQPGSNLRHEGRVSRYDTAMEEFRRHLKMPNAADDVAMMACTVSLISSSVRYLLQRMCLRASILEAIMYRTDASLTAYPWRYRLDLSFEHRHVADYPWISQKPLTETSAGSFKSAEESSRDFFIGAVMRIDILSAITRGSAPALTPNYQELFKSARPAIALESVSGCQNWVLDILLDVYQLRDWKANTKAAGLLSLWELTSKANTIQVNLEARIASNTILLNKIRQDAERQKDKHQKYDVYLVSHIFACAVSVLLEVIVSGAHPRLPEVKRKVGRAVEALTDATKDSSLLDELGWPLFVVGCVVEEERHGFFRQLLSSANLFRILELLERCWKSRACGEVKDDSFDFSRLRYHKPHDVLVI